MPLALKKRNVHEWIAIDLEQVERAEDLPSRSSACSRTAFGRCGASAVPSAAPEFTESEYFTRRSALLTVRTCVL